MSPQTISALAGAAIVLGEVEIAVDGRPLRRLDEVDSAGRSGR